MAIRMLTGPGGFWLAFGCTLQPAVNAAGRNLPRQIESHKSPSNEPDLVFQPPTRRPEPTRWKD